MNKTTTTETYVLPGSLRLWEQFWFTPADPSLLGLIRVACGLIVVYTLAVYSLNLQDFVGAHAWHDMQLRDQVRRDRPVISGPWRWSEPNTLPVPKTDAERDYVERYFTKWGVYPPLPYTVTADEEKRLNDFINEFRVDLRINGLKPPKDDDQFLYAQEYCRRWKTPPPAYPRNEAEALEVALYMEEFRTDPRRLYDRGTPVFSLWFHILEPETMAVVHGLIVFCAVLFTIGFCTRITSALTWFGSLCYIHRSPPTLFGVDTMMLIVLLYLMISPCGAVFSVDSLIRRWWVRAKPGVVGAWRRFWGQPIPAAVAAPLATEPAPSVAANIAIRLLQIHVCIIYLVTGLSKLQGQAWWTGDALWMVLGNYEFAPVQFEPYLEFIRLLANHQWLYNGFMTGGGLFTLAFEIGYAFLIWRPRLRWVMLGSAILLHGLIGLFMGLQTFSLMMLVMNMVFLSKNEVLWCFGWFGPWSKAAAPPPVKPAAVAAATGSAKE